MGSERRRGTTAPRVGLHLTDRCQLDCDHCLRDPGAHALDLALEVIDRVLSDARARHGVDRVSITGGEPTLHPRFPEVIDLVVRHGMTWNMVTNGGRFERVAGWLDEAPARRAALTSVAFSVDGATDATHDAIRGPGQRREVLAAMAIAVAYGIPFSIVAALHARNAGELEAMVAEAAALGATHVRFGMTQPTGTPIDADLALAPGEWRAILGRIERVRAGAGIPIATSDGWPGAAGCGVLRGDTIHVDAAGRLTMCCMHSGLPGDPAGRTVAGDASEGLAAYPRLEEIWAEAREALAAGAPEHLSAWADFGCNTCLARYDRPHWSGTSVQGAPAARERWRGAWAPDRRRLPVVGR